MLSVDGRGVLVNKIIFNLGFGQVSRDLEHGRLRSVGQSSQSLSKVVVAIAEGKTCLVRRRRKKDVVEHLHDIFKVGEQRFSVKRFLVMLGIFLVSLFLIVWKFGGGK